MTNLTLFNHVMNSAIMHLEARGVEVTPYSHFEVIHDWYVARQEVTPAPDADELLKVLQVANDRLFCTMIATYF